MVKIFIILKGYYKAGDFSAYKIKLKFGFTKDSKKAIPLRIGEDYFDQGKVPEISYNNDLQVQFLIFQLVMLYL